MKPCRCHAAFSLVEVVLAVAIVAFALVAIFGMLGGSLKTSADTLGENEALNARETLQNDFNARLSGTNFNATYTAVREGKLEDVLVFCFSKSGTNQSAIYLPSHPDLADAAANRTGRLLRARIGLSPNFPILGVNKTTFAVSDLPATPEAYPNAALGLSVRIYEVPDINFVPPDSAKPLLRYDTAIRR